MIKNKKAWLRIVEAFVAILIITSILLVSITKFPEKDKSEEVYDTQRLILNQVALNDTLREEVLNSDGEAIQTENFIRQIAPAHWNLEVKVCEIEQICKMENYIEKNVYVDEVLIASTLYEYPENPKILKLFVWEK